MSIILTDPAGLVLSRQTGDRELDRRLDRVSLAPGFSYAEEHVGTNGIGTALEVGGPAYVFGHEHYAEDLEELVLCRRADPRPHRRADRRRHRPDLLAKDAGPLLLTLAKNTAEQIRQALLAGAGAQQLALLQEYLRTVPPAARHRVRRHRRHRDPQRPGPRDARPRRTRAPCSRTPASP